MEPMLELEPTDGRKSFYGKARFARFDDGVYLWSYGTKVAFIDNDNNFHRLWGGYSQTTMRHVNAFLDEFGVDGGGKSWWTSLPVEKV